MSLSWIDNEILQSHIETLIESAQNSLAQAQERRHSHVVDPFSSLSIAVAAQVKDSSELNRLQDTEAALRGMSNALGAFHQGVLGSIEGWKNHDAGYDLECPSRKILAEVKNKHNTMNAATRRDVEGELNTALRQKSGSWTGYLVIIIPKKPERYERHIEGKASGVKEIDGTSFYYLATGDPNAIHDLFDFLTEYLITNQQLPEEIATHCRAILETSLPPRA